MTYQKCPDGFRRHYQPDLPCQKSMLPEVSVYIHRVKSDHMLSDRTMNILTPQACILILQVLLQKLLRVLLLFPHRKICQGILSGILIILFHQALPLLLQEFCHLSLPF